MHAELRAQHVPQLLRAVQGGLPRAACEPGCEGRGGQHRQEGSGMPHDESQMCAVTESGSPPEELPILLNAPISRMKS